MPCAWTPPAATLLCAVFVQVHAGDAVPEGDEGSAHADTDSADNTAKPSNKPAKPPRKRSPKSGNNGSKASGSRSSSGRKAARKARKAVQAQAAEGGDEVAEAETASDDDSDREVRGVAGPQLPLALRHTHPHAQVAAAAVLCVVAGRHKRCFARSAWRLRQEYGMRLWLQKLANIVWIGCCSWHH